jgi:hypothetical protein
MTLDDFVNRRTRELHASTRSEIVMSISAALLFTAVVAWRFASVHERLPQLGVGAVMAWVLVSLYVFRDRIWRSEAPGNGALAATGVDHYRRQLLRRRAHLRNAWLWHGPLLLACLVLAGVILRDTLHAFDRLLTVLPLLILLVIWTGFGLLRRLRQADELQREIAELDALRMTDAGETRQN